jgi:hypothetical protein
MNTFELIILIFGILTMIMPFLWILKISCFDEDRISYERIRSDIHSEIINVEGIDVKIDYLIKKPYQIIPNKEIGKICAICLEIIGDTKCELVCKHGYHFDCIQEWAFLKKNNNCPECRRKLINFNFENYSIV